MDIDQAYNTWASEYDSMQNPTRDLEGRAAQNTLAGYDYKQVLELGCGTGKNTSWLCKEASVTGLDFSDEMLAEAKKKLNKPDLFFVKADLNESWPVSNRSYDLVTCSLTLEHIENIDFIFEQAYEKLEKGGLFYICELHPYKQYQGSKARFELKGQIVEINTFTHHVSDYINAALLQGFKMVELREWFDQETDGKPPRLLSFVFQK